MSRVAFLIPIKPGKRDEYIRFAQQLSAEQLAELYRQYGVTAHSAFVGPDVIVSYYEVADPKSLRAMWALPAVQDIVRTQLSSMVELDPLNLQFLDVAFAWEESPTARCAQTS
jgi:L-rhamnose mutarotase